MREKRGSETETEKESVTESMFRAEYSLNIVYTTFIQNLSLL